MEPPARASQINPVEGGLLSSKCKQNAAAAGSYRVRIGNVSGGIGKSVNRFVSVRFASGRLKLI